MRNKQFDKLDIPLKRGPVVTVTVDDDLMEVIIQSHTKEEFCCYASSIKDHHSRRITTVEMGPDAFKTAWKDFFNLSKRFEIMSRIIK